MSPVVVLAIVSLLATIAILGYALPAYLLRSTCYDANGAMTGQCKEEE